MVCMPKINLGIDMCFSWCVEEVRNEWKWISVFLRDSVEASEVDTKSKRAVFFPNEEDWGSMGGPGRSDEPCGKVLVNELLQSCKFLLGQGVDRSEGRSCAFV